MQNSADHNTTVQPGTTSLVFATVEKLKNLKQLTIIMMMVGRVVGRYSKVPIALPTTYSSTLVQYPWQRVITSRATNTDIYGEEQGKLKNAMEL